MYVLDNFGVGILDARREWLIFSQGAWWENPFTTYDERWLSTILKPTSFYNHGFLASRFSGDHNITCDLPARIFERRGHYLMIEKQFDWHFDILLVICIHLFLSFKFRFI